MTTLLRRATALAALAFLSTAATCPPKPPTPPTPPPPGPTFRAIAANVLDQNGRPLPGATVKYGDQTTTAVENGYALFLSVEFPKTYRVVADKAGCLTHEEQRDLTRESRDFEIKLLCEPTRPTPAQVRAYRGYLSGLKDSAGRHIWTPALPGAPPEVEAEWLQRLADAGATHVPIGPFTPGPVYVAPGHAPVVHWDNPDWRRNPAAIRALALRILNTRTRAGHGMIPVIFFFGEGREGEYGREAPALYPTLTTALDDLGPYTITLPCGWESQGWRARECHDATNAWKPISHGSALGWHGWTNRSNGSSNDPFNKTNDDPCLNPPDATGARYGDGACFWLRLPFEVFLYQAAPVQSVGEANCPKVQTTDDRGKSGMAWTEGSGCGWKTNFASAGYRVGRSICADGFGDGPVCSWPTRTVVFFEAVAYFYTRNMIGNDVQNAVADNADAVCREMGVNCGFGDGLPARLRP